MTGTGDGAASAAVAAADHVVREHALGGRHAPTARPHPVAGAGDARHGGHRGLHGGQVDLTRQHLAVTVLRQSPQHHPLTCVLKNSVFYPLFSEEHKTLFITYCENRDKNGL